MVAPEGGPEYQWVCLCPQVVLADFEKTRLQCGLCGRQSGSKCPQETHAGGKFDPKIFENSEYGILILGMVAVGSSWFSRKCVGEEEAKVCCNAF